MVFQVAARHSYRGSSLNSRSRSAICIACTSSRYGYADPAPGQCAYNWSGASRGKDTRYIDIHEGDVLEEGQMANLRRRVLMAVWLLLMDVHGEKTRFELLGSLSPLRSTRPPLLRARCRMSRPQCIRKGPFLDLGESPRALRQKELPGCLRNSVSSGVEARPSMALRCGKRPNRSTIAL